MISELRCEMELDILEIFLSHLEDITGICQENVPSLTVFSHILVFPFLEILQLFLIIALNPTCLV